MTSETQAWLLDTNMLSAIIKRPGGAASIKAQSLMQQFPKSVFTSVVVACELEFGARRVGSAMLTGKIAQLLTMIEPRRFDQACIAHYAHIRTELERIGKPIGPNDTLIAAHALALDATVVTDNEAEFRRVPGLRVENWVAAG